MKTIFLAMMFVSSFSFASRAVKVFDGSAAYCPDQADRGQDYVLTYKMQGEDLVITASVCDHGQWVADKGFINSTYQAPNGLIVQEKFKNFKIIILSTTDYSKSLSIPAQTFESLGYEVITKENLSKLGLKVVDVNLQATRETSVDGRLQFVDPIWWGQIRVFLKK